MSGQKQIVDEDKPFTAIVKNVTVAVCDKSKKTENSLERLVTEFKTWYCLSKYSLNKLFNMNITSSTHLFRK